MKRLDASSKAILDISWSPDSRWVAYSAGGEIRLANAETQEIRIIAEGRTPRMTKDMTVLFEQADEICLAFGGGVKKVISRNDVVRETPKRAPVPSPDDRLMVFSVCNVFDKISQSLNAYPRRHFLAMAAMNGGRTKLLREQWYGGTVTWFPDGKRFCHFEFDSTAGPQIHVLNDTGQKEGQVAGLYPSVSPDGTHIAARPRGGGSMVIYASKGGWRNDDITTSVVRIPAEEAVRSSATPPIWLDNRLLLVLEGNAIFRIDAKKQKAEELKKFPIPTERRTPTMVASPDRELLAMEVKVEGGFELRVGKPTA